MAPLSNKQGYELARIATNRRLPVELQRQIWADVTKNYYLRGSVTERAAMLLQAAWRRLRAIFWIPDALDARPYPQPDPNPNPFLRALVSTSALHDRYFAADDVRTAYMGSTIISRKMGRTRAAFRRHLVRR